MSVPVAPVSYCVACEYCMYLPFSACTSASLEPSYVLRAIGADEDLAHSSIRLVELQESRLVWCETSVCYICCSKQKASLQCCLNADIFIYPELYRYRQPVLSELYRCRQTICTLKTARMQTACTLKAKYMQTDNLFLELYRYNLLSVLCINACRQLFVFSKLYRQSVFSDRQSVFSKLYRSRQTISIIKAV